MAQGLMINICSSEHMTQSMMVMPILALVCTVLVHTFEISGRMIRDLKLKGIAARSLGMSSEPLKLSIGNLNLLYRGVRQE